MVKVKTNMMCIGGPKDGQVVALESGCDKFQWRMLQKMAPAAPYNPLEPKADFKLTTYERMSFIGGTDKMHYVMAEQSLSPDDVLSKLIESYLPGKEKQYR